MSAPKTWVAFELLTASEFNSEFRDRFNAIATGKGLLLGIGDVDGPVIATGVKGYPRVTYPMRITGWSLIGIPSGSIVIDLWRGQSFPTLPTVADTITGSEKPTLSGAQAAEDQSLGSWSPDLNAGDLLALNVDSVTSVKVATLTLHGTHLDFL